MYNQSFDPMRPLGSLKHLNSTEANAIGHLMFVTALSAQERSAGENLRVPRALAAVIRMVIQDTYPSLPRPVRADVIMGATYAASLHVSQDAQVGQECIWAMRLLKRVPWANMGTHHQVLLFDRFPDVSLAHSFSMQIELVGDPEIDKQLGRMTLWHKPADKLCAHLRPSYPLASFSEVFGEREA